MAQEKDPEPSASIFVGVGVGTYDYKDKYPLLENAVTEVKEISSILAEYNYAVHVYEDPIDNFATNELPGLLHPNARCHGRSLVILWAGHGEPADNGGLKLITRNTQPGTAALLTPAYLADMAAP
jgi:hypothetical protein